MKIEKRNKITNLLVELIQEVADVILDDDDDENDEDKKEEK